MKGLRALIVLAAMLVLYAVVESAAVAHTEPCPDSPNVTQPGKPCPIGPFMIRFETGRADISSVDAAILDNAIEQYRLAGNVPVIITGHTDRVGTDADNMRLARRRAEAVRAYLARAIHPDRLRIEAVGESDPAVETADGVAEAQNRYVRITFDLSAAPRWQ